LANKQTNKQGETEMKTVEQKAQTMARKINRRAIAMRTTGCAGWSGYFQAYVPCKMGGLSSIGRAFHVA
jgi:hypothetical protein